jgi:hypothetical protein
MAERFPGFASRVKERLRALGYWRNGKEDVRRFCKDHGWDPAIFYPFLKTRVPGKHLAKLARDLKTTPAWLLHGDAVPESTRPVEATADADRVADHVVREFAGVFERLDPETRTGVVDHLLHQVTLIASLARRGLPPEDPGEEVPPNVVPLPDPRGPGTKDGAGRRRVPKDQRGAGIK